MVTVRRRYKGWQIEVILEAVHGHWRCEEVCVSQDPRETPMSLRLRGAFADVMAAIEAAEGRARDWIDQYGTAL